MISTGHQFRLSIPVQHLDQPSIEGIEPIDSMQIDEDPSWRQAHSQIILRPSSHLHKNPQTLEVLCEIPDDECGNHSGGRSLAQKALNIGYFWPTMRHDSTEYVKRCDRCQRPHAKKEMMIVATDYFTQWIEVEALSSTKEADVERFITAFFKKYGIKQHLSTSWYPQGNSQAKASNK
ncbi:hypothetical protein L3X38_017528 [Prunus dulcis]|uniref:Integrase zinc-binding domain-containing protein n=1 Tax=Prunus dulcis TaxID=3755 RepID=A0AAD4Z986_PRUDU|nr:hypothetical protein L3X38_017528 [Prunus dulcis]